MMCDEFTVHISDTTIQIQLREESIFKNVFVNSSELRVVACDSKGNTDSLFYYSNISYFALTYSCAFIKQPLCSPDFFLCGVYFISSDKRDLESTFQRILHF